MKLEHKTIKYIAYGLIIVFFIVLLSQNNNKQLFEGLENLETKEEKKADEKKELIISKGIFQALETEKNISQSLSRNEYSDLINIGTGRYIGSEQKYIDQSPLLNSKITVSNTQYAADISGLKRGIAIDGSNNVQQIKDLTTNLNNIKEHIQLVGLNLINGNLTSIIGENKIPQYIEYYITNYGDVMKVIDDLNNYLENNNTTKANGTNFFQKIIDFFLP